MEGDGYEMMGPQGATPGGLPLPPRNNVADLPPPPPPPKAIEPPLPPDEANQSQKELTDDVPQGGSKNRGNKRSQTSQTSQNSSKKGKKKGKKRGKKSDQSGEVYEEGSKYPGTFSMLMLAISALVTLATAPLGIVIGLNGLGVLDMEFVQKALDNVYV